MTPARKKALQWFYDRGPVRSSTIYSFVCEGMPRRDVISRLVQDGFVSSGSLGGAAHHTLTDKGRQALHGDDV